MESKFLRRCVWGGGGGGRGPGPPTFRVIKESSLEGSFATVRANYNRDMLRMQEMAFYSIIFPNFLGLPLDFQNARAFRGTHKIPPSSIGITPRPWVGNVNVLGGRVCVCS